MAIVLFHSRWPLFSGGFVGVDVFFVISGYLITQKILREVDEGRFTLVAFYIGRLRRLFPALLTTVAVTFTCAAALLTPNHFDDFARSAIAAVLWIPNVFFWQEADYWSSANEVKPLLHMWSLGVELQFYLVWPLLIIGVGALRRPRGLPAVLVAVGSVSLVLAQFWDDRGAAFYLTPFRVFEFAIGGLTVFVAGGRPRHPLVREALAAIGLALILLSALTFNSATRFPGLSAMVPCLGTALVIVAGTARVVPSLWRNTVAIWIGRRGYSLYLVHWPLFVLFGYWKFDDVTDAERIGLIVATFVLADLLFRFVEERFRYPPRDPARRSERRFAIVTLVVAMGLCVPAASAATQKGWIWRVPSVPDPAMRAKFDVECVDRKGLCPGGADVVLVGDSHARRFAPAVAWALIETGLSGTLLEQIPNCKLLRGAYFIYSLDDRQTNPCRRGIDAWFASIERIDPRIVILSGFWPAGISAGVSGRLVTADMERVPTIAESRALLARQLRATIQRLSAEGRAVIVLGETPLLAKDPTICLSRPRYLAAPDCSRTAELTDPAVHDYLGRALREATSGIENVLLFDTFGTMCPDLKCRLRADGLALMSDRHHLSLYGALWLQHHHFGDLQAFMRRVAARADAPRAVLRSTR